MTDMEVIEIADKEVDQIAYALSHSPGVYDNPGLRQIYKRKYEWLAQLLSIAKRATKSCEPDWIPHTDPPKSNGRYEVAMKNGNQWHISVRRYHVGHQAWKSGWERRTGGVRFWRPLPMPPKKIPE